MKFANYLTLIIKSSPVNTQLNTSTIECPAIPSKFNFLVVRNIFFGEKLLVLEIVLLNSLILNRVPSRHRAPITYNKDNLLLRWSLIDFINIRQNSISSSDILKSSYLFTHRKIFRLSKFSNQIIFIKRISSNIYNKVRHKELSISFCYTEIISSHCNTVLASCKIKNDTCMIYWL